MKLTCKFCGYQFESLILDKEIALKELETKSTRHIQQKHEDKLQQLATAIQVANYSLTSFMHFDNCVFIPEDETFVQGQIDKRQEIVMVALGYDPKLEEEEEEEYEDDEVEDEDEEEVEPKEFTLGVIEYAPQTND